MIQRIQTIWLFLSALCAAFTYKFPFYTGNKIPISVTGEQQKLVASSNFLLLILTAVLIVGTFIIIFLYKNRKQQLWLTILALVISIVNIIIYFTELKKFVSGTISLTAILSFIIPIFLLLAANGIWRDEKLVKSLDRLR
jgi:drug/metabolite transporter (DMT)-like permease